MWKRQAAETGRDSLMLAPGWRRLSLPEKQEERRETEAKGRPSTGPSEDWVQLKAAVLQAKQVGKAKGLGEK